jgi:hypothetical protein
MGKIQMKENNGFENSLDYIERPCFKNKANKRKQNKAKKKKKKKWNGASTAMHSTPVHSLSPGTCCCTLKYLPNKTRVKLYLFSLNSHFPSHL